MEFVSILTKGKKLKLFKKRLKLEISMEKLRGEIRAEELWFWGKILGLEKDYYICLALYYDGNFQFPQKKYYFCNSISFILTELPEIGQDQINDAVKFNTYFVGNSDIILERHNDGNNEMSNNIPNSLLGIHPELSKQQLQISSSQKKNFTELDRLSFVVRKIDNDTNIVPEGSFKMLPIHELRRNDNFKGKLILLK